MFELSENLQNYKELFELFDGGVVFKKNLRNCQKIDLPSAQRPAALSQKQKSAFPHF